MHLAWVIKSAHGSFAPDNHRGRMTLIPFHSFVLMDDTVLIEPELGFRPQLSVALSEYVIKATLGESRSMLQRTLSRVGLNIDMGAGA